MRSEGREAIFCLAKYFKKRAQSYQIIILGFFLERFARGTEIAGLLTIEEEAKIADSLIRDIARIFRLQKSEKPSEISVVIFNRFERPAFFYFGVFKKPAFEF